ncbi:hypothetical protein MKEN_00566000 [Mycena kentingensis (nom. inval.)]|nr:hypothetical protein MKEN_00566000 [Mycena kentingensis (nom. inval.)]
MPRTRIVDDTDPSIHYSAQGWFAADPNTLKFGNFGPIFNITSRATTTTGANFTFAFNGTGIGVIGSLDVSTNANNITDPSWTCFVDELPIPQPDPTFPYPENNWELCRQYTLAPGAHTLRVEVTSAGGPFYLDYLNFSDGWAQGMTNVTGAQVRLTQFFGTSITMTGFIQADRPHPATWATYALDGGAPVNFTLPGLPPDSNVKQYNALLFTIDTPPLADAGAPHDLVVTYGGDGAHTPLGFTAFYVTNQANGTASTNPDASSSSSLSPGSSSLPSTSTNHTRTRTRTGAIAGGTIAGAFVLFLLLFLGAALYLRRRRRQSSEHLLRAFPAGPGAATATGKAEALTAPSAFPFPFPSAPSSATPSPSANSPFSDFAFDASAAATIASESPMAMAKCTPFPPPPIPYAHPYTHPTHPASQKWRLLLGDSGGGGGGGHQPTISPSHSNSNSNTTANPNSKSNSNSNSTANSKSTLLSSPQPIAMTSAAAVMQHHDSGIRLGSNTDSTEGVGAGVGVEEVPPGYSLT